MNFRKRTESWDYISKTLKLFNDPMSHLQGSVCEVSLQEPGKHS